MKLIEFIDYEIKVADEALLVGPIRRLYQKDKSKYKENFLQQMSIVFFLKDPRSNYNYILNEKDRLKEILLQEGLPTDYKISKELLEVLDIYDKLSMTSSQALLNDTKLTINKIREVLKSVDFTDLEEKDKVTAVKTIASVVSMIPKLVKDLAEAERIVAKEIEEQNIKGNEELTVFDTGIDL